MGESINKQKENNEKMTCDMKLTSITMLLCLALATPAAMAQNGNNSNNDKDKNELYQVVIGDKDFVPVKRNTVMKNVLPEVKKPQTKNAVTPDYSLHAVPTVVPNKVPTMLPYGYRTGHNFSAQRGYLMLGAGSQLNVNGSAGYRFIDEEDFNLGAWVQHNSTWKGKNSTPELLQPDLQEQHFNDNVLGLDLSKDFKEGTLTAGARFHYDSFNYYGAPLSTWRDEKQGFVDASLASTWNGKTVVANRELSYNLGLNLGYAAYNKSDDYFASATAPNGDMAKEFTLKFNAGAGYQLNAASRVGLDLTARMVNNNRELAPPFHFEYGNLYKIRTLVYNRWIASSNRSTYGVFDISPYYRYEGEGFRTLLGLNATFSASDGASALLSPRVKIDVDMASGTTLYLNALGGKTLNTLAAIHEATRYVNPSRYVYNTFSPLDLEAGLRMGPWRGFSLKVYAGYGIFRNAVSHIAIYNDYSFAHLFNLKARGIKVGAHLNYQYRSLVELDADFVYAPQDKSPLDEGKNYAKSYLLGLDGASTVMDIDLRVTPIKKLTLGLGVEYRGNRRVVRYMPGFSTDNDGVIIYTPASYDTYSLKDVINLKARAQYSITPRFAVWAQASNLLGKQWDVLPGMGAQKLGIMGGISVNF